MLTQALGNPEHHGRTSGAGVVPWKIAFEDKESSYRSRVRSKAAVQAQYEQRLKEMEDRMAQYEQILSGMRPTTQVQPIPTSMSPFIWGRSSCGSTPLDDGEENAPHPVDNITEAVNVNLYIRQ